MHWHCSCHNIRVIFSHLYRIKIDMTIFFVHLVVVLIPFYGPHNQIITDVLVSNCHIWSKYSWQHVQFFPGFFRNNGRESFFLTVPVIKIQPNQKSRSCKISQLLHNSQKSFNSLINSLWLGFLLLQQLISYTFF